MDGILLSLGIVVVCLAVYLLAQQHGGGNLRPIRRCFTSYPEVVQTAAYRFINPPFIWPSYLNGKLDQVAQAKVHFERKRTEAAKLNNPELRNCVLAYIDYHVNTWLPRHERELRNQTSKKELEAYQAKRKNADDAVEQLLRKFAKQNALTLCCVCRELNAAHWFRFGREGRTGGATHGDLRW